MKKKAIVLDIGSTVVFGDMLFLGHAPWWLYVGALAFGVAQRLADQEYRAAEQPQA